jgi:hypothetical protein
MLRRDDLWDHVLLDVQEHFSKQLNRPLPLGPPIPAQVHASYPRHGVDAAPNLVAASLAGNNQDLPKIPKMRGYLP